MGDEHRYFPSNLCSSSPCSLLPLFKKIINTAFQLYILHDKYRKCIYSENFRNDRSITYTLFLKLIMIRLVLEGKVASENTAHLLLIVINASIAHQATVASHYFTFICCPHLPVM